MPELREQLEQSRAVRTHTAELEWRGYIAQIARGETTADDACEMLDRLMLRLQLRDDSLIRDVERYREWLDATARREAFAGKRAEYTALRVKATKKRDKVIEEGKSWEMRARVAEQERTNTGRPFGDDDRDAKRIAVLERNNPRLFDD